MHGEASLVYQASIDIMIPALHAYIVISNLYKIYNMDKIELFL